MRIPILCDNCNKEFIAEEERLDENDVLCFDCKEDLKDISI